MLEMILKNVTEAENRAEQIRMEAEHEAANILSEARAQAEGMKAEAVQSGRVREREFLEWVHLMSTRKLEEGAKKAEEEAKALRKSVEPKKKEAMDAIIHLMI